MAINTFSLIRNPHFYLLTTASPEPQIKKHLTAEEQAMRRAEMARRRKNLSEKRNEEEKAFYPFLSLPSSRPPTPTPPARPPK